VFCRVPRRIKWGTYKLLNTDPGIHAVKTQLMEAIIIFNPFSPEKEGISPQTINQVLLSSLLKVAKTKYRIKHDKG
jgi:hypothetical protein